MTYTIAGIDVHKKVLMVVVADVSAPDLRFERRRFGATTSELEALAAWLDQHAVKEVVMESTAQYWKPVWLALEPHFQLHLAQAQSNRAPGGRKSDFRDAERLLRRLVADELFLSYVPAPEQRVWRTLTRSKLQLVRERVRLQNQIEALLEEGRIKLSSVISQLLGDSGLRIRVQRDRGDRVVITVKRRSGAPGGAQGTGTGDAIHRTRSPRAKATPTAWPRSATAGCARVSENSPTP